MGGDEYKGKGPDIGFRLLHSPQNLRAASRKSSELVQTDLFEAEELTRVRIIIWFSIIFLLYKSPHQSQRFCMCLQIIFLLLPTLPAINSSCLPQSHHYTQGSVCDNFRHASES